MDSRLSIEQLQNVHVKVLHSKGAYKVSKLEVEPGKMVVRLQRPEEEANLAKIVISGLKKGTLIAQTIVHGVQNDSMVIAETQNSAGIFEMHFLCLFKQVEVVIGGDRFCVIEIVKDWVNDK